MLQKLSSVVLVGHRRLTDSPARTNVVLFLHRTVRLIIRRVADLAAALPGERRVSARWGRAGELKSFFNILLTNIYVHWFEGFPAMLKK